VGLGLCFFFIYDRCNIESCQRKAGRNVGHIFLHKHIRILFRTGCGEEGGEGFCILKIGGV